jgi:hypothetical protein
MHSPFNLLIFTNVNISHDLIIYVYNGLLSHLNTALEVLTILLYFNNSMYFVFFYDLFHILYGAET